MFGMSTHCLIAKKKLNGDYTVIWCKHDGYVLGVGKCLLEHYQDETKVDALIDLGDVQSVGAELGEAHDHNDFSRKTPSDWTIAYARDCGHPWDGHVQPRKNLTTAMVALYARGSQVDHVYVFDEQAKAWLLFSPRMKRNMPLSEAVAEAQKLADWRRTTSPPSKGAA